MNIETLNIIRQHIIDSELRPPYPYLDTKGNLTIGTGFHIEKEKEFLELTLFNPKTGKEATDVEKRDEFEKWAFCARDRPHHRKNSTERLISTKI